MTILEQNAKKEKDARDDLRKRLYTTLKDEVAEYMKETGKEPTNITKARDDAKKAVKVIKTDLNKAEEEYSTVVSNYKRAYENNGAVDLAVKAKVEIRELKIKQNDGKLLDISNDEDVDENLGDDDEDVDENLGGNGLFVKNEKDAKDDLVVAKVNRLKLRTKAEKRKRLYTTLKDEVAEYMKETGEEPTNIAKARDDVKKAVKVIKTKLNEAEEEYATVVSNYKKAYENNGADDLAVKKKHLEVTKEDIQKAKDEIRELKIKQNNGKLLDVSNDEDVDDGLFVNQSLDEEDNEDIDLEDI
ncbi:hypothetical protein VE00_10852 [Pseudogymnoascus sp. WSF 3629]|nr:hypothetical protein VE00_10852 [Pseudogymnoascus sp. WSF 3629]